MNPLTTLCARGLVRPHLLALAAALALPATAGAQATNTWQCTGGTWTDNPACWSLGTPVNTQNVVIPGNPTGFDQRLLHAFGNTLSVRGINIGADRSEPVDSVTAFLLATGSTINVTAGIVNVGIAGNANARLSLTNNSTLNVGTNGGSGNGLVVVGRDSSLGAPFGIGSLLMGQNSRIVGTVWVYNGLIEVSGSSDPGYRATTGEVQLLGANARATLRGSVGGLFVQNGSATLGTSDASSVTPAFSMQVMGGAVDFVGRSVFAGGSLNGGVTTIKSGASVTSPGTSNPVPSGIGSGAQLVLESGGSLTTQTVFNEGFIQLQGGNLQHAGITNRGTVTGAGYVGSGAGTFTLQPTGVVFANGGDLVLGSRFDGSAGGAIGMKYGGRLFFYGDAAFKAGQVITQGGTGALVVFAYRVDIGNATQRGSLEAMTADLALQNTSNLFLDFDGASDHDYLSTGGTLLVEGGKLTLSTAGSFRAGLGSFYNVFRGTSGITGTFSSIDATAFALAPGAKLDMSNLYTTGTLAVVAVPEPATWLSLGAGLLLIGARARRWREVA